MPGRVAALLPDPASEKADEIENVIVRLVEEAEAGSDCEALIAELEVNRALSGNGPGDHSWNWMDGPVRTNSPMSLR